MQSSGDRPVFGGRDGGRAGAWALAGVLLASLGCTGGELAFHGEHDVLAAFEHDTGLQPAGSPVQVRAVARGHGTVSVDARATAAGSTLAPVAGSGALRSSGGLSIEIHARIDTLGIEYEGLVHTVEYALPQADAAFDPFLLDGAEPATTRSVLPEAELARVPIPSVPGATLVLRIVGGEVQTTFAGTCAAIDAGRAQYRGHLTTTGTIDLGATVEIEAPLVGSRSFGPFSLGVPIPAIESELDLGTLDVASGARLEGAPFPCDAVPGGPDGGATLGDGGVAHGDGGVAHGDGGGRDAGGPPWDHDGGSDWDAGWTESTPVFWLGPGFSPDPAITGGHAGGKIDASTFGVGCNGFFHDEPSHVLHAGGAFPHLRVVAHGGPVDLTLAVLHPDGSFDCNDDFEGTHPMIARALSAGEHHIYVGTYSAADVGARYRLAISELTTTTPGSIGAP